MAFTTGWWELTDGTHTKLIEKPDDICNKLMIIKKNRWHSHQVGRKYRLHVRQVGANKQKVLAASSQKKQMTFASSQPY